MLMEYAKQADAESVYRKLHRILQHQGGSEFTRGDVEERLQMLGMTNFAADDLEYGREQGLENLVSELMVE